MKIDYTPQRFSGFDKGVAAKVGPMAHTLMDAVEGTIFHWHVTKPQQPPPEPRPVSRMASDGSQDVRDGSAHTRVADVAGDAADRLGLAHALCVPQGGARRQR